MIYCGFIVERWAFGLVIVSLVLSYCELMCVCGWIYFHCCVFWVRYCVLFKVVVSPGHIIVSLGSRNNWVKTPLLLCRCSHELHHVKGAQEGAP